MKKILAAILSAAMIFSLTACGASSASSAAGASSASSAGASKASGTGKAKYVLKLGDSQAETHPQSKAYHWFANRVSELTNGEVEVQVFVNSALGTQAQCVEGLSLGTVEIAKNMATGFSTYVPEIQIFDLPYMFKDKEHFLKVLDSDIGAHYLNDVLGKAGLVGLCYFYAGSRCFYTTRKVEKLADLKGMKIRVPDGPIYQDMCKAFGASGTPIPMGDIYTALQTHVVDGAENATIVYDTSKHYEPATYFLEDDHIMTPDIVAMSKSYLASLPEADQKAILQAGKEMAQEERKLWDAQEASSLQVMKDHKVTITKPTDAQLAEFRKAAQTVWSKYESVVGKEWIDKVQAMQNS
ncbi:TRAP transporter substrate-binding protein [Caproiciproducens sp. NJN-50]|uniref:TRAP transporter substrate-binding protein n=1 Tax=Caproiciproducens sp. NJN-50 TaxID=2507162 RepID=UPI0013E8CE8C|nr:TRAP transporter substrate-binding protein [Caproiciproducens sp. NJN-50]